MSIGGRRNPEAVHDSTQVKLAFSWPVVLMLMVFVPRFSTVLLSGKSKVSGTSSMLMTESGLMLQSATLYMQYALKLTSFSSKLAGRVWQTVVLDLMDNCFLRIKRKHQEGPPWKSTMSSSLAAAMAFRRICVVLTPRSDALCSRTQLSTLSSRAGHLAL